MALVFLSMAPPTEAAALLDGEEDGAVSLIKYTFNTRVTLE